MAMRSTQTAIGRDEGAYRRGLVLGLTMAEIMLLLVFCLLIAAAVIFKNDRQKRDELQAQRDAAELALADAQVASKKNAVEVKRLSHLLEASGQDKAAVEKLNDEWRKLVAAEDTVQRIEGSGLITEDIIKSASDIQAVQRLLKEGMKGEQIVQAVMSASADQLKARLAENEALANLPPAEVVRLATIGSEQEKSGKGEHDWPPIINLSEAKGYSFATGRANLSAAFVIKLQSSIADDVLKIVQQYNASVIEVIGHTDEQPMAPRPSNLDAKLISVLGGESAVESLFPGDNAGLGMARAVSVAGLLRSDPRFSNVTVIPLSGGQMILPGDIVTDGKHPGDARDRRRIEIRVRRPEASAAAQ